MQLLGTPLWHSWALFVPGDAGMYRVQVRKNFCILTSLLPILLEGNWPQSNIWCNSMGWLSWSDCRYHAGASLTVSVCQQSSWVRGGYHPWLFPHQWHHSQMKIFSITVTYSWPKYSCHRYLMLPSTYLTSSPSIVLMDILMHETRRQRIGRIQKIFSGEISPKYYGCHKKR